MSNLPPYLPEPAPIADLKQNGIITRPWLLALQALWNQVASSGTGTGDVVGPGSSTDNAIARFDGTTGKLIQNSGITISDAATGTLSGTNTGDQDTFKTIAVSGQSDVVADGPTDTLTLVAGTNITITTVAGTDSVTINAVAGSGGTGNSTYTGAEGSEPGANTGDLYFPNNGFYERRYSGSLWKPWGPIYPMTEPISDDFAWVNQGGASIDTTFGGVYLEAPSNAGSATNMRIRKKAAPSTPYTITLILIPRFIDTNVQEAGLVYRESGSGKLLTCCVSQAPSPLYLSQYFTNPTTFSSGNYSRQFSMTSFPVFLQIDDDGTNRHQRFSTDGQHWFTLGSQGRTTNLTADEVGFYVNDGTDGTDVAAATFLSWAQT